MKELVRIFEEKPVRMIVRQGEPWWVAKDVAEVLGYVNTNDAIAKHCKGVAKRYPLQTAGGIQELRIIPEPDLYRLIIGSTLPAAEAFERWIFEQVLPSIRKTGAYSVSAEARKESSAARSALCRQWQEHGADKFYHYINLTKAEYGALYGDRQKKKAEMTKQELAALMVLESVEYYRLVMADGLHGYRALEESIKNTAKTLPLFAVAPERYVSA